MSLFEKIKNKTLVEKKSDSDYFAKDNLGNVYKTERITIIDLSLIMRKIKQRKQIPLHKN